MLAYSHNLYTIPICKCDVIRVETNLNNINIFEHGKRAV